MEKQAPEMPARLGAFKLAKGGSIRQAETVAALFLLLNSPHGDVSGVWLTLEDVQGLIGRLSEWAAEAKVLAALRGEG